MRQTILALLVVVIAFLAPVLWDRFMNAAPELAWRILFFVLVLAGMGWAILSDPIYVRITEPRANPLASTAVMAIAAAIAVGSFWWSFVANVIPVVSKDPSQDISAQVLQQQKRLEFLQHRSDAVNRVTFFVRLDKQYTAEELGTFRVVLMVLKPPTGTLYVTAHGPVRVSGLFIGGRPAPLGVQHTAWSANADLKVDAVLQDTMIGGLPSGAIQAWSGAGGQFNALQSFDGAVLAIHVTEGLWPKVSVIGLAVNDYVIFNQPLSCLAIADPVHAGHPSSQIDWPPQRRPTEDTKWVKVVPAHYKPGGRFPPRLGFSLPYSAYTPVLMNEMTQEQWRSLALPTCDWYGDRKP